MEEIYEWRNLMDRHQVFATNIFVQDNFVFEETATQMKNYIQRLWQEREPGNNWQTDPDLQTKEEFKIFSDNSESCSFLYVVSRVIYL